MEDRKRIIQELNLFCSPDSILVLDRYGKLLRLFCPFPVMPTEDVNILKEGEVYHVVAVKISDDLVLLYVIYNIAYPYYYFKIL